jgi:cAMP-dependent protein kinase regulator
MGCSASKETAAVVAKPPKEEINQRSDAEREVRGTGETTETGEKPESGLPQDASQPAVDESSSKRKLIDQARTVASKVKDHVTTGGATAARHLKIVFAAPLENPSAFEAPVFPKSSSQRKFIAKALNNNVFFNGLAQAELQVLLGAFEQHDVEPEAFIIRQDDVGDYFYVLMDGECSFWVNEAKVGSAKAGDCFGELALLYTSPRAASVQADTKCTLFRVDQTTFRYILQTQTLQAEQEKRDLLVGVPFFEELDSVDLNKVVATMRPHPFQEDEYLVKRGEEGDVFYIIQEGKVKICDICVGNTNYPDQTLGPGDFFGERALVTKEPRIANCIALTKGVAFVIDKTTFETVLGSLSQLALKSQDKRVLVSAVVKPFFFNSFVLRLMLHCCPQRFSTVARLV